MLDECPPDGVAFIPGMLAWAQAAVANAQGNTANAGDLCMEAAHQAHRAGAIPTTLWYLADAARWGAPQAAAEILSTIPTESPLSDTRAAGIRARTSRHSDQLLSAAEQHLTLKLWGHAAELADLAIMRTATHGGVRTHPRIVRARQIARQARNSLKHPATDFVALTGMSPAEVGLPNRVPLGVTPNFVDLWNRYDANDVRSETDVQYAGLGRDVLQRSHRRRERPQWLNCMKATDRHGARQWPSSPFIVAVTG